MRRLLLALPFALLPLAIAQANEDDHHHDHDHAHEEHGSLGAHEHGVARLNAVLDGNSLEIELESPSMNLVGFEHEAHSEEDKAKVAATRDQLEKPAALFGLPAAAGCELAKQELESPLFGDEDEHHEAEAGHDHEEEHSEIHAHYRFTCNAPEALEGLNLSGLFGTFPATQKIQVQLIGPNGQQGAEANAQNARLNF
ncbi:zinc-binding protein [Pseudomonas sp. PIC25]|uniref:DUF2796 domain-containing protein n=1 Tax=Pseudomonas sp. PIC25 TaxID=1958773 RepID=UPI000BABA37D|nr:DUF2796 domain-containing protein [Pseudomonas sp. PIC25]PAU54305.1 zinc-binding protein [Pseudomonas sp. PIC25]